jgi:hypothetical protein
MAWRGAAANGMDTMNAAETRDQLDDRLQAVLGRQFIILVGAPRSGTTWLVRMLGEHPSNASVPAELTLFSRYLGPWMEQYAMELENHEKGRWSQGMPMLLDHDAFHTLLQELAARFYERVLQVNPHATHILDKHPYYSQHMPVIDRVLPGCRFIHIIRDGREVAVSMMSARRRIGFGAGEIKGAATNWLQCVTHARAYGAELGPERYLEVRYEDLKQNTAGELARILGFAGLGIDGAEVERIASEYHISRRQVSRGDASLNELRDGEGTIWKQKLSLEERYLFHRYAGHLLEQLGYGRGAWWALSTMERLRMWPYPFTQKLRRSLRALLHIWNTPAFKPVN